LVVANQGSRQISSFVLDDKTGAPVMVDSKKLESAPLSVVVMRPPLD
jgi:hypothetical protein